MEHWSRAQRHVFGFVAVAVCALTFAYSFYIEREIVADEPGLYNAIYTFVETGRIAYPLHGQPEFMTVHPPTHYLVIGLLMKLGLSLFAAAAVPLVVLTTVVAIVVATGGFPFAIAVALLLAGFSANVIWADYLTVRPDLHLTLAWFAGLVTLEAARNRNWSRWRLALGSVLSVYAATLHYWGIPACAMPLVYAGSAAFTHRHDPRFLAGRLASVAAGGLAVGLPFLIWFVVPRWESIIAVAEGVQGEGGLSAAVERHLDAYSNMLQRSATGWGPRPVVTALLYPLVALRIPAVIAALLTFMAGRRYTFAVAGSLVPAFVLLYSQGKPTGLTVYYTPEMTLYLTGAFACCFSLVQWAIANTPRPVGRLAVIAAGAVGVGSLVQVPSAAGSEWRWTRSLHNLELSRAAGFDVLGSDALVGMISLEPWYIAGARYAWIAANDLTLAQRAGNIEPYLRSVKAFAIDKDWWHALPELAPLGSWYWMADCRCSGSYCLLRTAAGIRSRCSHPVILQHWFAAISCLLLAGASSRSHRTVPQPFPPGNVPGLSPSAASRDRSIGWDFTTTLNRGRCLLLSSSSAASGPACRPFSRKPTDSAANPGTSSAVASPSSTQQLSCPRCGSKISRLESLKRSPMRLPCRATSNDRVSRRLHTVLRRPLPGSVHRSTQCPPLRNAPNCRLSSNRRHAHGVAARRYRCDLTGNDRRT